MRGIIKSTGFLLALTAAALLFPGSARAEIDQVPINEKNFPDQVFRQYVSDNFDTDGDAILSRDELEAVTEIDCSQMHIRSLVGISNFVALRELDCSDNEIWELDLSGNPDLTVLDCDRNWLSDMDLTCCPYLYELRLSTNDFTKLDLTRNSDLNFLTCYGNNLCELDLSGCPVLVNTVKNGSKATYVSGLTTVYEMPDEASYVSYDSKTKLILDARKVVARITSHPESRSVDAEDQVSFSVGVSGGSPTYQWQFREGCPYPWKNVEFAESNGPTLTFTAKSYMQRYMFRCLVTNPGAEPMTSGRAILYVADDLPHLISMVTSVKTLEGSKVEISLEAVGDDLSYQWMKLAPGGKWVNCTEKSARTDKLTFIAAKDMNGYQYKCIVSNPYGKEESPACSLSVDYGMPQIREQSEDVTVEEGETAVFSVVAEGADLTYQWQYCEPGKDKWVDVEGTTARTNILEVKGTAAISGRLYRCVFQNPMYTNESFPVTLTVLEKELPEPETEDEPVVKRSWQRLFGQGRYDTMQAIVKAGFTKKKGTVIVATGTGFKDALAAAGLAGLYDAPVILTDGKNLSKQAKDELVRLAPKTIYVAGGTFAVSDNVLTQIENASKTMPKPKRVFGQTSSGTSAELALKGKGNWSDTAIIATNRSFKDALSVAPLAYANKMPILLADNGESLSREVKDALRKCGIKKIIIVGGTAAVKKDVEDNLKEGKFEITARLAGKNGVETSAKIATYGIKTLGMNIDGMGVATSQNYPDALAGAAFCGHKGAVLVLADDKASTNASFAKDYKNDFKTGYVFGGESAVGKKTMQQLNQAVK